MTPEHNMIDGTGNPPEEGGTAGTGDEGAPVTGEGGSSEDNGENGDGEEAPSGGEGRERPNVQGRGRGEEPQRSVGGDMDEVSLDREDRERERTHQLAELDERRELVSQAKESMEAKLDKEKLGILHETNVVDINKIAEIGIETGFTFDEFTAHLRILGHSEDTIRELESRRSLFRDDTEVDTDPDVMDVASGGRNIVNKLVEAKESGDEEKINAAIQEGEGFIAKIKNRLFDPGTGLLREEDRGKRLFVKPIVTMLLALIISYMLALSVMTRGSTKRVGGG